MKNVKITHLTPLFLAAFLLAATNFIVVPDVAFADPPACKGKNKNDSGCDGGGGGGGAGNIQTCEEVFGVTSGCTCSFDVTIKDTTDSTPPEFVYVLQHDCATDTMLVVPVFGAVLGNGFTLDAVGDFSGEAVVTNEGFRAVIQDLTINIDSAAADACDGTLRTGILYSINSSTLAEDPMHPAIRLLAQRNIIKSQAGRSLCRGIEATRTADAMGFTDRFVRVNRNEIWPDSYAETGILVRGFGPSDATGSEITASNNNVSQGVGDATTAMQIGPASTDVVSLEKNLLAAGPSGAGLAIFGDPGFQIDVLRNSITGGMFGIRVDDSVLASNITGNSLVGDPSNDGLGDIAVCDDSEFPLDRRNKSTGYDNALMVGGCSLLSPAPD